MTTAQKRGFRFPWGGDPGRDAEPSHTIDDEPSLAERLGGPPDDLGRGPFDLRPPEADEPGADDASEEPAAADVATMNAPTDDAARAVDAAVTGPDAPVDELTAAAEPAAGPSVPAAPAPARTSWPESDRRSAARTPQVEGSPAETASGGAPAPGRAGKANPLVTGLVRAMRDAAKTARNESVASLRADATSRAEAIRSEGAGAVAALRKTADADVAAIREWSKAEMARIREETDARIAARKEQLVTDTDDHARATEATLASLAEAVSRYEAEAAAFFDRLLAEEDPARLAGLAERMPAPPALDAFGGTATTADEPDSGRPTTPREADRVQATIESETAVDDGAAAETAAGIETARVEAVGVEAAGGEAAAHAEPAAPDATANAADAGGPDASALDAEAAAEAEAAALAGLDGQTQVIVSGLSGVASISAFKGALMQDDGVSAVSVNAGNDGDCVFTVTHTGDTDVRVAVRDMTAFQTRLIADDGETLVVVAQAAA